MRGRKKLCPCPKCGGQPVRILKANGHCVTCYKCGYTARMSPTVYGASKIWGTGDQKLCSHCGVVLSRDAFYSQLGKGVSSRCKSCEAVYNSRWKHKNRPSVREKQLTLYEKDRDERLRKAKADAERRRIEGKVFIPNNHLLAKIRNIGAGERRRAIEAGRLERGTKCAECGRTNLMIMAKVPDYEKPLECEWLCVSCVRKWYHDHQRAIVTAKYGAH